MTVAKIQKTHPDQQRAFLRRMIRSYGKRVSEWSPEELAGLVDLEYAILEARAYAVVALRSKGYAWSAIGAALGISRQAAQQRYGSDESAELDRNRSPDSDGLARAALKAAAAPGGSN